MTTLTAKKISYEILTAEEYLKRRDKDPRSVEGARILTPKLGSKYFGWFEVPRSEPVYEVLDNSLDVHVA